MKIPMQPPKLSEVMHKLFADKKCNMLLEHLPLYPTIAQQQKKYLHWDKLRRMPQPSGWSPEEVWLALKLSRKTIYNTLPFFDKHQAPFCFAMSEVVLQKLHQAEQQFEQTLQRAARILNTDWHDTYLINSLIEEAITSSQLEGASTTRKLAKQMLRSQRKPGNMSEQMILNNYHAMQFVKENCKQALTVELLFELHEVVTEKTLPAHECGKLRTNQDDIHIYDVSNDTILHTPPRAEELQERLEKICRFANESGGEKYIHPMIKAIILHFMLAYDHPFVDGNGRTARALFYWYLLKKGCWLGEFISISKIIHRAQSQYVRAFLYTETDDNDVTYFIIHQLDTILKAFDRLNKYLEKQMSEITAMESLLNSSESPYQQLNYRQIALLQHALKHPTHRYLIAAHQLSHGITYQTARTDLLNLVELALFKQEKSGRAFVFLAAPDLRQKLGVVAY